MNDNRQTTVSRVDYVRTNAVFFLRARFRRPVRSLGLDVMTARIFFSYADRGSNSIEHARAPFLRARGGRTPRTGLHGWLWPATQRTVGVYQSISL